MINLNKIYFGSAGTGKTREAINVAEEIVRDSSKVDDGEFREFSETYDNHDDHENLSKREFNKKSNIYPLIDFVTFHPSYSYQDFIEGIRITEKGGYEIQDGIFKKIVNRALKNPDYNYVLIIDEINRGDISAVFGEFFTLLEESRRFGEKEAIDISLPYSKTEKLKVPKNLHILATMNTVDKSIALIDIALRRRFEFIEIKPKPELLKNLGSISLENLLTKINQRITFLKNENYQIGHSYFLKVTNFTELQKVMTSKIIPLLQEYFYDDWESVCAVLNQSFKNGGGILKKIESSENLFSKEFEELIQFSNRSIFRINKDFSEMDLKKIYE